MVILVSIYVGLNQYGGSTIHTFELVSDHQKISEISTLPGEFDKEVRTYVLMEGSGISSGLSLTLGEQIRQSED